MKKRRVRSMKMIMKKRMMIKSYDCKLEDYSF